MIENFEDLEVYKRAYKISLQINKAGKSFPKDEISSLTPHIRKCAQSICIELAQGFNKKIISKKEYRQHILIAQSSVTEIKVLLNYCRDLKYIERKKFRKFAQEYLEISKMLELLYKSVR